MPTSSFKKKFNVLDPDTSARFLKMLDSADDPTTKVVPLGDDLRRGLLKLKERLLKSKVG